VDVPVFQRDDDGSILPNPLFHRAWDKLHSRTIEYPFAASQIDKPECILDAGTPKSDPAWIAWLESLPMDVTCTDFESPTPGTFSRCRFVQADLRRLPFPDASFDFITAVSIIEHIGLASPQVHRSPPPLIDEDGDWHAIAELCRVLAPAGRLVITVPFGPVSSTRDDFRVKASPVGSGGSRCCGGVGAGGCGFL
jgi:SAM-dependent methyltransferase